MARDNKIPVTFLLPDGDIAELITWDYVVDKLTKTLSGMMDDMDDINRHLTRIDNKLTSWLPENDNEGELIWIFLSVLYR